MRGATAKILGALRGGDLHTGEIAKTVGMDSGAVGPYLFSLLRRGVVTRRKFQKPGRSRGPRVVNMWSLAGGPTTNPGEIDSKLVGGGDG